MMCIMFSPSAELGMTILLRTAIAEIARFEGAVLVFGNGTVLLKLMLFATLREITRLTAVAVETVIEVAEVLGMTIGDVAWVGATCAVAARGGFAGRGATTRHCLRIVAVCVEAR